MNEVSLLYKGKLTNEYTAHQMVWGVIGRKSGSVRDFVFRYVVSPIGVLFHVRSSGPLLAGTPVQTDYPIGSQLKFELEASPSARNAKNGAKGSVWESRDAEAWLIKMSAKCGFAVINNTVLPGRSITVEKDGIKFFRKIWRYNGELRVTDSAKFTEALQVGMGSMKAFGAGMLVVKEIVRLQ